LKAAVLHETGAALRVADVELRGGGPLDVRVRIAASGVCRSDLSVQQGAIPHELPVVLGHEGAGIVEAVGADVTTVSPGDHVILSWIAPCRRCFYCLHGRVELCEHGLDHAFAGPYGTCEGAPVFGGFGTATFAQETVVPEAAVVAIDHAFPLEVAALIGCGVVTGVGAVINTARVEPGATVAVVGCGGVGLAAIQGARLAGAAQVIAVDRVPAKLAMATENGATDVVDAGAGDPVARVHELSGGRGVDDAFEVVGLASTIQQAYAMARRGGTVTVVGAGGFDDLWSIPAMQLMVDAKTIRGRVYGATDPSSRLPADDPAPGGGRARPGPPGHPSNRARRRQRRLRRHERGRGGPQRDRVRVGRVPCPWRVLLWRRRGVVYAVLRRQKRRVGVVRDHP
jgi:S-(hydroxymethyl)glutathione dehydrogenase / alcohol dehydrogenase